MDKYLCPKCGSVDLRVDVVEVFEVECEGAGQRIGERVSEHPEIYDIGHDNYMACQNEGCEHGGPASEFCTTPREAILSPVESETDLQAAMARKVARGGSAVVGEG